MMVAVWIAAGVLAGVVFGLWIGYELGRWWAEERWWRQQRKWEEETYPERWVVEPVELSSLDLSMKVSQHVADMARRVEEDILFGEDR